MANALGHVDAFQMRDTHKALMRKSLQGHVDEFAGQKQQGVKLL